jgi:hypothetical protein
MNIDFYMWASGLNALVFMGRPLLVKPIDYTYRL